MIEILNVLHSLPRRVAEVFGLSIQVIRLHKQQSKRNPIHQITSENLTKNVNTSHLIFEENWEKMKLNKSENLKIEFLQKAEHGKQYLTYARLQRENL